MSEEIKQNNGTLLRHSGFYMGDPGNANTLGLCCAAGFNWNWGDNPGESNIPA